jgi:hypothetical protein
MERLLIEKVGYANTILYASGNVLKAQRLWLSARVSLVIYIRCA